ncbi:ABC transporter ATP-binding protein [Diaminobutyricimonas sp. TR449]|uniref:ABC transporter ATP-binding protein n=1 Tax=Diaminobutyricimonas sp. TR449 TaxID=2708076 RepID=UPI0014231EE0|nr:ABC transporter ATP-binding protein [Diaminobutyricimonas sp. TR449]
MTELAVTSLSASYGLAVALTDVSISLRKGETVGLLGRNGAGKTTLLKSIINNPELSSTGEVLVGGRSLQKVPTYKVARLGVAWVPDNRRIFTALSVAENLDIAKSKKAPKDQLDRVLESVPLVEKLMKRRGFELSGGEQQAVTIARALMSAPDFLLLDEPTEGLAPLIVEQLQASISRLPALFDIGVLVTEQNFRFVTELADRIHILETGRSVWTGTPDELIARPELINRHLSVGEK